MFLLYIQYSILDPFMRHPDDLLLNQLLCLLRVPHQVIQLLISNIALRNPDLPPNLALHRRFVLRLDLLTLSEHIPEPGGKGNVDESLHASLGLFVV